MPHQHDFDVDLDWHYPHLDMFEFLTARQSSYASNRQNDKEFRQGYFLKSTHWPLYPSSLQFLCHASYQSQFW